MPIFNVRAQAIKVAPEKSKKPRFTVLKRYDPESLVTEFLHQHSFSVRSKILSGLSKSGNSETIEEIYNHVLRIYGKNTANIIIPGLSIEKQLLLNINNKYRMSEKKATELVKKDPDLMLKFFENAQIIDKKIFSVLVNLRPKEITDLIESNKLEKPRMGRRTIVKYTYEDVF